MAFDHLRIHCESSDDESPVEEIQHLAFVSFDIVGHSTVKDHKIQVRRIKQLNEIVRETIEECRAENIVWASGGDGGHVAFGHDTWQVHAVDMIVRLKVWSHAGSVPLRVVAHVGDAQRIEGADGRTQLVGQGINLAGRLLGEGRSSGVIATKEFKQSIEQAKLEGVTFSQSRVLTLRHFGPKQVFLFFVAGKFESEWDSSARDRAANHS